jgi:lysophospholipase L1-like esterase
MTASPHQPAAAKGRWWMSLLLLIGALVVALALAEGLVRLASGMGLVDLDPTLAEVALPDEIAEQVDRGPQTAQGPLYVGDPVLHHRMAPNWSGAFPEEIAQKVGRSDVTIQTNSLGLRSAKLIQPKPDDLFRIVVLGDSVTFGWGVRGEDTYTSQLAGLLAALHPGQRYEVVNAGVSGYGTWQEALWLQDQAAALQPDLVVVQAHLNDAADNLWGTFGQATDQPSALAQKSALVRLIQLVLLAQRGGGTGSGSCANDWNEAGRRVCWETTTALLDDIQTTAQTHGAQAALMPMPMRWQVEPGITDPRTWVDTARYQGELGEYARGQGWLFVDPLPAFQNVAKGGAPSHFLDVGHPNEAGHRLLAQELYRALNQAGLLP